MLARALCSIACKRSNLFASPLSVTILPFGLKLIKVTMKHGCSGALGGEEDQGKDGRANEKQLPDLFK